MIKQSIATVLLFLSVFSCSTSQNEKQEQAEISQKQMKVFRYNQSGGITSLDPAYARSQANVRAIMQLYNTLFEFTPDLHEVPQLVDSYTISADELEYTFKIKQNVYFHDNACFEGGKGRELEANDFVYSFKRIVDPKNSSSAAWIFNDKVKKNSDGTIADDAFESIDKYTLKINLESPYTPFLQVLAAAYTSAVPQEAVEKYGRDFSKNPVGTGPFYLSKWDDNKMVALKYDKYWNKDELYNQLPYLDGVEVQFVKDKTQELLLFKENKLDFVTSFEKPAIDEVFTKDGEVKPEIAASFEVKEKDYMKTEYIGFQLNSDFYEDKEHPFLNTKIRKAMAYAVNRKEIIALLRNNLGSPGTHGFVPPVFPSFEEKDINGYGFNTDKAQQLLKEAGYANGDGFPITILYTTAYHKAICEQLQKIWKKVLGITINIEISSPNKHQEAIRMGQAKLFSGNWIADYPDEENYLACFYSANIPSMGPNKFHYKNEQFDKIFEEVHTEHEGFRRHEVYRDLDQSIMNDCPLIVLFYDKIIRLHQKGITGMDFSAMNHLRLEKVDFDDNYSYTKPSPDAMQAPQ